MNKNKFGLSPTFSYLNDIMLKMSRGEELNIYKFMFGGGRYTGKTANALVFAMMCADFMPEKSFRIYLIRKTLKNIKYIFEEYINLIPPWYKQKNGLNVNYSNSTIRGNNYTVRALGLKDSSQRKIAHVGLPRGYCDYVISIYDEAGELDESDLSAIKGAIAGQKESIRFFTSNPFFPGCWFFRTLEKVLPWNRAKMMTTGEDFYISEEDHTIYHWTNILRTKEEGYISKQQIEEILKDAESGSHNAEVIAYGKPAVSSDIIFPTEKIIHIDNLLQVEKTFEGGAFRIGVDFGRTINMTYVWMGIVSRDRTSVITLCEKKIIHKNRAYNSTSLQTTIFTFIHDSLRKFGFDMNRAATVYTDDNEPNLVHNLRMYAKARSNIYFVPVKSKNSNSFKREIRITSIKEVMSVAKFYVLKNKCPVLLECLNSMKYKHDANDVNKLVEDNSVGFNDPFDAMCYGLVREIKGNRIGYLKGIRNRERTMRMSNIRHGSIIRS